MVRLRKLLAKVSSGDTMGAFTTLINLLTHALAYYTSVCIAAYTE